MPEAPLRDTEHGRVPEGDGWFVLNARDAEWFDRGPRGFVTRFEAGDQFEQIGINLFVLEPGQPMSMYHWEADQEDFFVLSGEALLIVEGEERPIRQWDLVHTPRRVPHSIVGAGTGPCAILAIGARIDSADSDDWGGYPVDEAAQRHNASAEAETTIAKEAYARFPSPRPTRYRDAFLPDRNPR